MNIQQATDDFLMYLHVEKNYSPNTLKSYAFDLKLYAEFLIKHDRSVELCDLLVEHGCPIPNWRDIRRFKNKDCP
ncbi:hypothetical protein AS030_07975 [Fictibacillus enclensis]|uniref:Core-binding (CB) domain-containing protein n=1 Tax=Fictibacillus enclensis TaxID=1017270 RepID=A0A0V8JE58_9BACL|nr:hypothetical protein AS030_07975 [Fictibacillus enclensis]